MTSSLSDAESVGRATVVAATSAALAGQADDFAIVARSDVPMCIVDALAPDMPIVFANEPFLLLSGYPVDEVVGRNCRFLQGEMTAREDARKFHAGLATGRPFQVSIVNHRKTGEAFRNEVFVSPIREPDGTITRFLGMQISVAPASGVEDAAVAAIRHTFRNQIQTMSSLTTLLGQRLADGEGREAFEDLRARFEAITAVQPGVADEAESADRTVVGLAERVARLYGAGAAEIEIACTPFRASRRRVALLAQITTEMLIDLIRATPASRGGKRRIAIEADGAGGIRIVAEADQPPSQPPGPSAQLGLAIASSMARSAGGVFARAAEGAFRSEATLPPEPDRR